MDNKKKSTQLGMPFGTASGRLRKMILFQLLKKYSENECYRCGNLINSVDELSIEHKKPWLGNDTALFWDLDNVAFSHLSCNSGAHISHKKGQRNFLHGTETGYRYGCRCLMCTNANTKGVYKRRNPG